MFSFEGGFHASNYKYVLVEVFCFTTQEFNT